MRKSRDSLKTVFKVSFLILQYILQHSGILQGYSLQLIKY